MARTKYNRNHYHVYVIELTPWVLGEEKFFAANPGYRYREDRPPLYVGMTGRTPEIRYQQHRIGRKKSKFTGWKCVRLRKDLFEHIRPMSYRKACAKEESLAQSLRARGYAVWQN